MTEPSYSLVTTVRTPQINPGDTVEIALYLTGIGNIDKSKLDITHSHPYVLSSEQVGKAKVNIVVLDHPHFGAIPIIGEGTYMEQALKTEGTVINPFPLFIYESETRKIYSTLEQLGIAQVDWEDDPGPVPSTVYPRILGELAYGDGEPPVLLELNTVGPPRLRDYIFSADNKIASSGDYSVNFTLTYGNDQKTYQAQTYAEYHVNSWLERNIGFLRVIGVFLSILALIPFSLLISTTGKSILMLNITEIVVFLFISFIAVFGTILAKYLSGKANRK